LWAKEDDNRVLPILRFLKRRRIDVVNGMRCSLTRLRREIAKTICAGGYVIEFRSRNSFVSPIVRLRREVAERGGGHTILHALLEPIPGGGPAYPSQLFDAAGLSHINCVDNLVARLYWLCYRNTTMGRP